MEIGKKLKELRLQKNLTQEELGERTDLTKGYISQVENNLSSPSLETFFDILEVLGTNPKDFFDAEKDTQQVIYKKQDVTIYEDSEKGYAMTWLIPDSNDKEMEPVMITLEADGEFKQFPPSLSETFGYVLKGSVELQLGEHRYVIKKGQSFYYEATEFHQLRNASTSAAKVLMVVTDSYL
ncbi:helix-turn-helix domain-containing protein [Jeotgalibaca caeni]|uniref:helix-turn-helix domain-containing protein n=1 Tax=Jeotgalibaca caeni TaxID=3028623 RepID=UPI00237E4530|nr:XRE family transcriptional regulator [Jeotgalibaca caeni]MDE1549020.1 XRE family transcriptional regulator [Jeotgalibaca caeni]